MNAVDTHPQRAEIIDAILAGESMLALSGKLKPPVGKSSLSRFRINLLSAAVKPLQPRALSGNALVSKVDASFGSDGGKNPSAFADGLRNELQDRVRRKLERRDAWLKDAEGTPVMVEGKPVIRDNGLPLTQMDHRALAAHDRNETADVDLLARLGQLYTEESAGPSAVTAVLAFGGAMLGAMAGVMANQQGQQAGHVAHGVALDPSESASGALACLPAGDVIDTQAIEPDSSDMHIYKDTNAMPIGIPQAVSGAPTGQLASGQASQAGAKALDVATVRRTNKR